MPESPSKSGTMDQGLFFAHFNRAKEFFDQARYHDAERELDEAYLLRPHDPRVLNLLGLVCFKQDRYEKAEEVYRKLVNQNPNSATLYFNLGLIYYKISRLDEAENAFVKAIEFSPSGNSKISFYLGSVYEKLHRFQDAIFQYRQAGANVMVRRMEDRMSPTTLPPSPPIEAIAAPKTAQNASVEAASEDKASAVDTTEEFPAKSVVPVSSAVMAAEVDKISTADTGRFHETSNTSPFALNIAAAHLDPPPGTRANKPKEIFRILENRLVEVDFSGKVFIKQGTIYSYSGNLTFWVKEKRPTGPPPLVILTGKGRVIMKDREREITLMYIDDEVIFVEPSHLLACEETLVPRYMRLDESLPSLEFVMLEGRGMVALSTASKPLALTVAADFPVSVSAASVITWSGVIRANVVSDRQIYEVMRIADSESGPLIRLAGKGRVLVEQALG